MELTEVMLKTLCIKHYFICLLLRNRSSKLHRLCCDLLFWEFMLNWNLLRYFCTNKKRKQQQQQLTCSTFPHTRTHKEIIAKQDPGIVLHFSNQTILWFLFSFYHSALFPPADRVSLQMRKPDEAWYWKKHLALNTEKVLICSRH